MQTLAAEIALTFVDDATALMTGGVRIVVRFLMSPIERLANACALAGVVPSSRLPGRTRPTQPHAAAARRPSNVLVPPPEPFDLSGRHMRQFLTWLLDMPLDLQRQACLPDGQPGAFDLGRASRSHRRPTRACCSVRRRDPGKRTPHGARHQGRRPGAARGGGTCRPAAKISRHRPPR